MKNKFKAFTLAEILISLTIIGVVAAIATPVITSSIGDRAIISSVKKHYKAIQMAITKSRFDVTKIPDDTTQEAAYVKNFFDKFNYVKYCADGHGCWPDVVYKAKNGSSGANLNELGMPTVELSDGSIIAKAHLGIFYVDINGAEGPNILGRDLFMFEQHYDYTSNTMKFLPYVESTNDCYEASGLAYGASCSYCAIFDNSLDCIIHSDAVRPN